MARCLVSFGANIGDARATIQQAAARLQERLCGNAPDSDGPSRHDAGGSFQLSRCYRTPPVGGPAGQPPFINAVAAVTTDVSVWDVWHCIRQIEKEFGRERNLRWEARRIDLDILLYDDARIWTPHLKIPHPRMCMRRFILLPAVDVAGDWLDPVSGWTIAQLADNLRTGASNFVLLAESESRPESLLAEVARRTGAEWRTQTHQNTQHVSGASDHKGGGRWVSAIVGPLQPASGESAECADWISGVRSGEFETKLVIALAPRIPAADVAWEDYHRALAELFGVRGSGDLAAVEPSSPSEIDKRLDWCSSRSTGPRNLGPRNLGPRYLLASDDSDWAVQELVAALEAMDCPIEPIEPTA